MPSVNTGELAVSYCLAELRLTFGREEENMGEADLDLYH
jgi:hypothetical protein